MNSDGISGFMWRKDHVPRTAGENVAVNISMRESVKCRYHICSTHILRACDEGFALSSSLMKFPEHVPGMCVTYCRYIPIPCCPTSWSLK